MPLSTYTYRAPSHWASYLVNGDHSGLSDAEKSQADRMILEVTKDIGNGHCVDCEEEGFSWRHDFQHIAGRLGGDVSTYTFLA